MADAVAFSGWNKCAMRFDVLTICNLNRSLSEGSPYVLALLSCIECNS